MKVVNLVAGVIPAPVEGDSAILAHFKAGPAEVIVERYDYRVAGGQFLSAYALKGNWPDEGCGLADLHLTDENWAHLDEVIAVLTAAREFIREVGRGR